jgi:hypothetical protein
MARKAPSSKSQAPKKLPIPKTKPDRLRDVESLMPLLLPRIGLSDDDADGVLIEAFEAAFALQIRQMTHDRPSPQNAFIGWGFGRRNGELIDRHYSFPAMEPER